MKLTRRKFDALAALSRDTAQVFLAAVVVGPLVSGERDLVTIVAGVLLVGFCAYLGISLVR